MQDLEIDYDAKSLQENFRACASELIARLLILLAHLHVVKLKFQMMSTNFYKLLWLLTNSKIKNFFQDPMIIKPIMTGQS